MEAIYLKSFYTSQYSFRYVAWLSHIGLPGQTLLLSFQMKACGESGFADGASSFYITSPVAQRLQVPATYFTVISCTKPSEVRN